MAKQDGKNEYKDTLNLPKTTFDMKAGLLTKEPAMLAAWANQKMYQQVREARADSPRFMLHDGPPYANGDIHMGHLLNKVLKDIVVRYRTMAGFDAPYVPGWDCHGLPIEAKVMEELGKNAGQMDRMSIRSKCRAYAEKYVQLQKEQFKRLGIWGDFDAPYITMDPQYEAGVLEVFARMVEQGIVYKQLKPVHWSIENQTALADAELEYQDRKDVSIYVLLDLADPAAVREGLLGLDSEGPLSLMIWTTTPWTLPANLAAAVHPDFEYAVLQYEDPRGQTRCAIVAADRVESVVALGELKNYEIIATVRGAALADFGVRYRHPIKPDLTCPVVTANYVTLEDGTGLVHTAPGHGLEDYSTGLKHGLDIYCPVRADGTFDDSVPEFLRGKLVWHANKLVCEKLEAEGAMFHQHAFTHSYPHDWRSKKPTIFRATEQWFVAVDRPLRDTGNTLRAMAMQVAGPDSDTQFVPGWGRNRLAGMLESRPDWCISRQRSWGLPIPAFVNQQGKVLLTPASVRAVAEHFAEHGSDSWFKHTPEQILATYDGAKDEDVENPADFVPANLRGEMDIFDVWFESGSSWYAAVLQRGLADGVPVDLYLEGSDQHRGWFQLSLLPALATTGRSPFKTVLTHGFVVDDKGYKMSKSVGNAVNVQDELARRGADILRLWVASVNYQDDIRTSDSLIGQLEDAYRKIRNTLRYAMGSCYDFNPLIDAVESEEHSIDRWMRMELDRLTAGVLEAYEKYEFHKVYRLVYEFCTVEASSIYMAAVKDRLYCELPAGRRRRSCQTVLHDMLLTLTRLLAPILPFTCEEAWSQIPNRPGDLPDSVHLAEMPAAPKDMGQIFAMRPESADAATFTAEHLQAGPGVVWQRLLAIRDLGLLKLEALRNAGVKNSLDAEVVFHVSDSDIPHRKLLEQYMQELEDLLGVGYARIETFKPAADQDADQGLRVEVVDTREKYSRCERSWKRRPDVGSDADYPDLSARDAAVVRAMRS